MKIGNIGIMTFLAVAVLLFAGMPVNASVNSVAPGTTLSSENLTLSAEMDQSPYLGGCQFTVKVMNSGEVAYPLDNCTVTVYDGAAEYRGAASGIVLPLNMAAKNIGVDYNDAHIMRDSQMQAIHTPLVITLTDARGKMVAIASLKEGVNLILIREKDGNGHGSFAALESWYTTTSVNPAATKSDANLSLGAQQVLFASLGGSSVNLLVYNHGDIAYPLDGCTATVYTKTGEHSIKLSGIVLPMGIAPKVIRINYDACKMEGAPGGGSWCSKIYGPTAVQINDANGKPIAMASLKVGANLEEVKMPYGSSDSDSYAGVIYG